MKDLENYKYTFVVFFYYMYKQIISYYILFLGRAIMAHIIYQKLIVCEFNLEDVPPLLLPWAF